jgi:hypothetical protein
MALKTLIAGQFYNSGGGGGGDMLKSVYDPANIAAQLAGRTVANIFSVNGAASTPAMTLAGTIFTGGSATTTKPQLLVEPAGTTSTGWSTSGTLLGVNGPNAFAGLLFDGQVNGVPTVRLFANGSLAVGNTGSSGAGYIQSEGNTAIYAFGLLMRNDAQVAWSSTGGYSGTKDLFLQRKAAATLQLGADAAGVTNQMITAANRITSDGVGANLTIAPGNGLGGAGGSLILSTFTTAGAGVAGTLTPRLYVNGPDGLLQFGGQTGSFPGLKRNSTELQCRLADDSDYAPFSAKFYNVDNGTSGVTAGPYTVITSITVVGGIVTDLQGS